MVKSPKLLTYVLSLTVAQIVCDLHRKYFWKEVHVFTIAALTVVLLSLLLTKDSRGRCILAAISIFTMIGWLLFIELKPIIRGMVL